MLLSVAVALCAGLMMTRVFKKLGLKLPDVTAFLIAGVCVGPYVLGRAGIPGLGFTSMEEVEHAAEDEGLKESIRRYAIEIGDITQRVYVR